MLIGELGAAHTGLRRTLRRERGRLQRTGAPIRGRIFLQEPSNAFATSQMTHANAPRLGSAVVAMPNARAAAPRE